VTNIYNSVKAPVKRGFSYIEIWMIGVQIPILVGVLEYAILLVLKKYYKGKGIVSHHDKEKQEPIPVQDHSKDIMLMEKTTNEMNSHWDIIERTIDKWTFVGALAFIITFNIIYWVLTLM
jgi:hypothetical protein